jgi:hypothetical protein
VDVAEARLVCVALATLITCDIDGDCDDDGVVDAGAGAGGGCTSAGAGGGCTNAWKYVLGRKICLIVSPSGSNGLGKRGSAVGRESRDIPKAPGMRLAPNTWNDRGAGRVGGEG